MEYSHHNRNCSSITLKAKIAELHKTKDDLMQAKRDAIESWLASKPFIDELEKVQTIFEITKNCSIMSNIIVNQLDSQLGSTTTSINSKKEDELKAIALINKINNELNETREEMEQKELGTDEKRRARSNMKQMLLMRRQSLEALELTQRAVRLELEAVNASLSKVLEYINHASDNATVQVNVEEYEALVKAAEEETSLTDWRLMVSTEQRLAAQKSRDMAFRRLEKLYYAEDDLKPKKIEEEITMETETVGKPNDEQEDAGTIYAGEMGKLVDGEVSSRSAPRLIDAPDSSSDDEKFVEQKKPSVFAQLRKFVANIT